MAVQKTEAIVIGHYALKETDKIIVFYSKEYGRIRAVAKGVRRLKSKLCGRMEIMTHGILVFYERENKDLHIVNSFDTIETFQDLRENLVKFTYCSYFAELIQQVEPENEANVEIFNLLLYMMLMMKTNNDPEMLARAFEINLLEKIGLSPRLDSCTLCSSNLSFFQKSLSKKLGYNFNQASGLKISFSVSEGGILCDDCSKAVPNCIFISRGTLELMKRIQQTPLDLITRLRISQTNRLELKKVLSEFISFHIDIRNLRSLAFLDSLDLLIDNQ